MRCPSHTKLQSKIVLPSPRLSLPLSQIGSGEGERARITIAMSERNLLSNRAIAV
ncbi:hypothetical protein [Fischerella sp. PCC 9605]|uniref:hypothetical protein n=1 Tax=Fischerella sp. PCC 9605 TaxID=1173024 RepID=UPI0018CC5D87|nr:hypothetical protein [Fischerella sp. PCC 9605]